MENKFYSSLCDEHRFMENVMNRLINELNTLPEGSLRVDKMKGRVVFRQYISEEKDKYTNGKYIPVSERNIALQLAQKEYDIKALKWLERTKKSIDQLIKSYDQNNLEIIYNNLGDIKKEMVAPIICPDDEYIKWWRKNKKTEENTFENNANFYTENGEHVRSKSEKILADKFMIEGIPYVYEPNLILRNGIRVFPDFAVLNVRTRQEYYLEHFGMMDDPDYAKKAVRKIEMYSHNDYLIGKNLLCTFETSDSGLGRDVIEKIIREYFK